MQLCRALLVAGTLGPFACGSTGTRPPAGQEYTEIHMGMRVRLVLYAADAHLSRTAARAAFDRIAALDAVMSDYRPDSELRRLQIESHGPVTASPELFGVMTRALEIAAASDGAFDPTVGPLVALWREARRTARLPERARLDAARALVGWRRVALNPERRTIRLKGRGMQLDLGGIAKGYILQAALAVLRVHGVTSALVEAGGDLAAGAAPPDRPGWHVDVPGASPGFAARAAALTNAVLSTSGDAAQHVDIGGMRYSHVVDPRTGLGVTHGSVAYVIAVDGATADAVATALAVLGPGNGREMLARLPGVMASVVGGSRRSGSTGRM